LAITINNRLTIPKVSPVYDTYWRFAAERQHIFFRRQKKKAGPWSDDDILQHHKFTNVYRITDRVSQYLLREVINLGDQEPRELLFRILLFKLFNKIETWESLQKRIGELRADSFRFQDYNEVLLAIKNSSKPIYSGAYIMASAKSRFGYDLKHQNHLKLIEMILEKPIYETILQSCSLEKLYLTLKNLPSIGSFLAFQYAIDINYSSITDFSEMDFVQAGPGAKDGIRKCFTDYGKFNEEDIIKYMADQQHFEFSRLELEFKDLYGRPLQLIDCQNLFCEVDKYARLAHPDVQGISNRTRIKQKFKPTNKEKIDYCFPKNWRLDLNKFTKF
jgi:hypothetical protein